MPGPCEQSLQSWTKSKNSFLLFVRPLQLVSIQIKFMLRLSPVFSSSQTIYTLLLLLVLIPAVLTVVHSTTRYVEGLRQTREGQVTQHIHSAELSFGSNREECGAAVCGEAHLMCLFGGHPNNSESPGMQYSVW